MRDTSRRKRAAAARGTPRPRSHSPSPRRLPMSRRRHDDRLRRAHSIHVRPLSMMSTVSRVVRHSLLWCMACALLLVGCATPYVRPSGPETVTPTLYADRAVMAEGYVLPLSVWRPPAGVPVRAVVLALHGLNDYRHAYAEVGPY